MNYRWGAGLVLTFGLQANALQAHDLWITIEGTSSRNFRAALHYGHPGDISQLDPRKVYRFEMLDHTGQPVSLLNPLTPAVEKKLVSADIPAKPGPKTAIFQAAFDDGFWSETDDKRWYNAPKTAFAKVLDSAHYSNYAKYLATPDPQTTQGFDRAVGQRLEIVPLSNPLVLKPGDSLRLRVLYEGKPLAGARIEVGDGATPHKEEDIPRYTTDGNGVAIVPIRKAGFVLLAVDHETQSPDSQLADKERMTATLGFVL